MDARPALAYSRAMSSGSATSPTLAAAIMEELRRRRIELGLSQDAVAGAMRFLGVPWTRSVVATYEAGDREVELAELFVLAQALRTSLADVLGSLGDVMVSDTTMIPAGNAPAVFDGRESIHVAAEPVEWQTSTGRLRREPWIEDPAAPSVRTIDEEASGDAVVKLADRLGLHPGAVVVMSYRQWGRGLQAEREARVGERAPADATTETLRAIRGHVSRELTHELLPEVKRLRAGRRKPKPKTTTRKRGKR